MRRLDTVLKWCVLAPIWVYRTCISPIKPPTCRFTPTCSAYAWEAIRRFGAVRGGWLALRRLLRCHPFYRGPLIDPVPEAEAPPRQRGRRPGPRPEGPEKKQA